MADSAKTIRLVRCPKCRQLLQEHTSEPIYRCGGCGAILQAKGRPIHSKSDILIGKSGKKKWIEESHQVEVSQSYDADSSTTEGADRATLPSLHTTRRFDYDVFLSFRGSDIHRGFANFLYKGLVDGGIVVLRYDEAILQVENIHHRLNEAIKLSRISIPIFSRNYATSSYCLHEVTKMSECRRTMGQIVIPIFYDVEPSDVQWQWGTYMESFQTHLRKGVQPHILRNWRNALQEIGSLKGHIVYGRNAAQVVREIVLNIRDLLMAGKDESKEENLMAEQDESKEENLMAGKDESKEENLMAGQDESKEENFQEIVYEEEKLFWMNLMAGEDESTEENFQEIVYEDAELLWTNEVVPKNLVGMDKRIHAIIEELQISSSESQVLEISGIPGIGKTTLAKVVYNILSPQFQACGFVSDIQKRATAEELCFLQKQLISQLIGENLEWLNSFSFQDNTNFIRYGFWDRRVLIVLDDVDCLDHIKAFAVDLHYFGPRSRIILTTQKPDLLDKQAKVARKYKVEALDDDQAFQLFCRHAFGRDFPDIEYYDLSVEIASLTRGIPSWIESIGSNLYQKSRDIWEEVLKVLSKCEQPAPLAVERFLTGESETIGHYDVVVSFDAQDKVNNLIKSLHERMKSFGIGILALDGDFMQVNDTGKLLIPVFSKSFVSRAPCLRMLEHMVECWRNSENTHILPIFFAVEPSDVSPETPLCKEAISNFHIKSEDELVNHWKEALTEVSNISRWSIAEGITMEEIENLTGSICQTVLHKLKLNQLSTGDHLVGMNHHMGQILDLLNLEVNDVRIIAISGEDGAGKTTLAKFVYQQLSSSFEGCSLLTEIDERTHHYDGIKCLQAKMVSDLLNRESEILDSVIEGINLIKERFRLMKVLIILDDVGDSSHVEALVGQLNWFGRGSRIIITTKSTAIVPLPHLNYKILHNWGNAFEKAYELFSKHTFRNHDLPANFESSSKETVSLLSDFHNPCLTIELLGSLLYGKGEAEWESLLQNLQGIGMNLNGILRMSYGSLSEVQKQIFLDISCFPNGMDLRIASFLWHNTLHSLVLEDIEVLILLSLVKVDTNNAIWMHHLVRDFGREIIKQERLQIKSGGESKHVPLKLPTIGFERMDKIRFFKLDHTIVSGSMDVVFMRQRDLIWQWCPLNLLATLCSKSLEVLDVSQSNITEDWEGWHQIEVPQLRVLNLSRCSELMVTPAFSFCPNLEMLILEHCSRLVKIDPSIGKLQRLTTLNLRFCLELSILPREVGCLTALRELPLDGTSLREIPISFGHLQNLTFLSATNCSSLSHLPSSTCDLRSVTVVKLDCTKITELPYFIGKRMKLRHLSLRGCQGIQKLPSLVGEVESSLVELDVSKTSIAELPPSIINLKVLRVLKMDFCFITEFPQCFGNLKSLEEIHATWCKNLEYLPDDIGKLESLRILQVGHTSVSFVPQSIKALMRIDTIDCTSCNRLQNLPELPCSLTFLRVESKELMRPPNLVPLKRLEEFSLASGNSMEIIAYGFPYWPPESPLRTLELCLPQIRNLPGFPESLRTLRLRCAKLEHISSLPLTLVVLSIQDCASLRELPSVENLKDLEEMEILCCPELKKIDGLEKLQALRVLTLSSSGIESLDGLDKLTSLVKLTLFDLQTATDWPVQSPLTGQQHHRKPSSGFKPPSTSHHYSLQKIVNKLMCPPSTPPAPEKRRPNPSSIDVDMGEDIIQEPTRQPSTILQRVTRFFDRKEKDKEKE